MLRSSERTTAPVTPTCLPVPVEAPVISSEGGALQGGSGRASVGLFIISSRFNGACQS